MTTTSFFCSSGCPPGYVEGELGIVCICVKTC
jgi:hypothetical protein